MAPSLFADLDRPVTGLGLAYNEWLKLWDTAQGGSQALLQRPHRPVGGGDHAHPLHYWSKGVCDPLPFLEDLVDFRVLNERTAPSTST